MALLRFSTFNFRILLCCFLEFLHHFLHHFQVCYKFASLSFVSLNILSLVILKPF